MVVKAWLVLLLTVASAKAGAFQSDLSNLQEYVHRLNFSPYYNLLPTKKVKIAVFDGGFAGLSAAAGKTLPKNVRYIEGNVKSDPSEKESPHGTIMAEIIYAMMTNEGRAEQFTPELYLYKVNGITNFREAINDALSNGIQIISYSEVKEFGSNWDGKGFWNREVNRATALGVIWVNSAGNLAHVTYNTPIVFNQIDGTSYVGLPDKQNYLDLTCNDKCDISIYLTWNDFKDNPDIGTNKDLDFALLDQNYKLVPHMESKLEQIENAQDGSGKSLYPREVITGGLHSGQYHIIVKSKTPQNFTAKDSLRITVFGENAALSHFDISESILNPADNGSVITVGALDSDRTSVSVKLGKPELLVPSSIKLLNNNEFRGSSNSTAMVAAGFGILKSLKPNLTRHELLEYTSAPDAAVRLPMGPRLATLGFKGAGVDGCFENVSPTNLKMGFYENTTLTTYGGMTTQDSTGQYKILVHFDPVILTLGRASATDAVVATQDGFKTVPREKIDGNTEIFQSPIDGKICDRPALTRSEPPNE